MRDVTVKQACIFTASMHGPRKAQHYQAVHLLHLKGGCKGAYLVERFEIPRRQLVLGPRVLSPIFDD